ncbi:MAG: TonB-dependent receptor [Pseudomonas sp.]
MSRVPRLNTVARPWLRLSPVARALRCAMLSLSAASVGLLNSGLAQAQTQDQVPVPVARLDDATRYDYAIAEGALGASLAAFASQSGLLLSYDPALVRGKTALALNGRFTVREGLQRLLVNADLRLVQGPKGSYSLVPTHQPKTVTELSATTVGADELLDAKAQTYRAPRSSVVLTSEDLDRFGRISAGDLLQGIPGVQVGDTRNGGALDVNIRGVQGQSRVAVKVDGAEQALDVYRGYAGTQQRSYIDPDLISSVTVNKGPTLKSGAIGGTVEMQTLGVKDILADGKSVGVRLKGDLWNNGVSPAHRSSSSRTENLSSTPHDSRAGLFGSDAQSGSAAFAFSSENLDLVAAYAHREQGNYFSGKKGQDRYRTYDKYGDEETSVATTYNAGEEVLNSSSKTDSYLLKATWRVAEGHTLDLGYRQYEGRTGEIMPSDIFRTGTAGIYQYPLGSVKIDTYTARYHYLPSDNPLIDLTSSLWMTDSKSSSLSSAWTAPVSQLFRSDRSWTRQDNRRIGADLSNISRFDSAYGDFTLDLGGSYQHEDLQPQKSVVITEHDINANRGLRDASREEYSFNGKLEYQPIEELTLWGGGRYSHFRTKDNGVTAKARREERNMRWMWVNNENTYGNMAWFPDQDGNFTDATDPRLNNGIVFSNSNEPFNGVRYNDFGATSSEVFDESVNSVVTGYDRTPQRGSSGSGFSPSFGVNYEWMPDTFVYASYTQGLRLPSLFETSLGTQQVTPGSSLKPERSRTWEVGASALRKNLLTAGDSAAIKLAYFDNDIKNYVTRYYDPSPGRMGMMTFSNTDSYSTRGLELQTHYDAGRVFADLAATYYLETETCDAAFAAKLRSTANPYQKTQDTPDCTSGSYMGSYTNTQNPPRLAANLTSGLRFFEQKLTVGGRVTYTSGPTSKADKPWQTGGTTPQIEYRSVALFDMFLNYKLLENTELNLSVQNLTDRYYLDPLAQSLMPAPGRTWRVGVQSKF